MRERDDDAPVTEPEGSLADGVGETAEPGGYESTSDPYGDGDFGDDTYGDDTSDSSDDDTSVDDTSDDDASGTDDDTYGTESTYGDGDGDVVVDSDDDGADGIDVDDTVTEDESPFDDAGLAEDNSPLEGVGFLIDEVREALFGDDDAAAASPFDTDPVDLETETDLDLTGDGVVDRADLHEAGSSFDFHADEGQHHHTHHDDGIFDA